MAPHPAISGPVFSSRERERCFVASVAAQAQAGCLQNSSHAIVTCQLCSSFLVCVSLFLDLRQCRAVLSDRHIWSGSKAIWVSRCALQASGHWHGGGLCSPGFSHMDSWLSLHTAELTNRSIVSCTRHFTVVTHGLITQNYSDFFNSN